MNSSLRVMESEKLPVDEIQFTPKVVRPMIENGFIPKDASAKDQASRLKSKLKKYISQLENNDDRVIGIGDDFLNDRNVVTEENKRDLGMILFKIIKSWKI